MNTKTINSREVVTSALLIGIGIIIPLISPLKIILEPASFTLGSHVAIFIAMFISPISAVLVSLGTTLGFFISGFPITVVLRAFSHIVFAYVGSVYIKKNSQKIKSLKSSIIFVLIISIIHALCEVIVVIPFYINASLSAQYYDQGFIKSVVLLIGVGTVLHSTLDYAVSRYIYSLIPTKILSKINGNIINYDERA